MTQQPQEHGQPPPDVPERGETTRSVLGRALVVLATFDAEHRRQSLSDVVRRSGLALATTHRLLGELAAWGALDRQPDGRYVIGQRLWETGLLAPMPCDLANVAMPFLQELYELTRENVHLAVLDGAEALYVAKLSGHDAVPIISRIGGRLPLHATGVGKALLAHQSDDVLRSVLGGSLKRLTPYTITEPGRLARELARVRRTGIATTAEEMTMGSFSVASPVLGRSGAVIAAVAVVVHSRRPQVERIGPAVRQTAEVLGERFARDQSATNWPGLPSLPLAGS